MLVDLADSNARLRIAACLPSLSLQKGVPFGTDLEEKK